MLQVAQDIRRGRLQLVDVPPPTLQPQGVRVRTRASLISAGTERGMIELARKSLGGKAKARPDLVRAVVDKARKEGVLRTASAVFARLNDVVPLGYSASGIVEAVGSDVSELRVGDRVAIAGAGYANHAEVNYVPRNLVVPIPDELSFEEACYTTVATIALQGVRIAKPEIGEYVAIIGLGLIGLLTAQILQAHGCRVIGIDKDPLRVDIAKGLGIRATLADNDTALAEVNDFTGGRLVDTVLITAASKSNGPVELAGVVARKRGTVVVIGMVDMTLPRDMYYKKELDLRISTSYGPGRYDPEYEENGNDYPYAYVRWTEQRNMAAVVELMSRGAIDVSQLTTHRYEFADALDAYDVIMRNTEPHTGVVLVYRGEDPVSDSIWLNEQGATRESLARPNIGMIGAGRYATQFLLPKLRSDKAVVLANIACATGISAQKKGRDFGFLKCSSDPKAVVADAGVDAVFVETRHATHFEFARECLLRGKHVFVEKPIVTTVEQLDSLDELYRSISPTERPLLMVGLNRRFAPMIEDVRAAMSGQGPLVVGYRVNAGHIPRESWTHLKEEGGGMLVGEMCHFIDVMQSIIQARPVHVFASAAKLNSAEIEDTDNVSITVTYEDGSIGTLLYSTLGDKAAPKERLEVFGGGRFAVLDDFRRLRITGGKSKLKRRSANQDKGQGEMLRRVVAAIRGEQAAPIPYLELFDTMRVLFLARESIVTGERMALGPVVRSYASVA